MEEDSEEEPPMWTREELIENCDNALKQVTECSLGYVYVSFPGKSSWEQYYVIMKDSQLLFMPSVKANSFTMSYLVNRITMRKTKKYIAVPKGDG